MLNTSVTTNVPSQVIFLLPLTIIGVPGSRSCTSSVSMVTMSLPFIVSIVSIVKLSSPLRLKNVGMFFTSSSVSHLVLCSPYSKSVSIKFSGWLTRNLLTGSIKASSGSNLAESTSTKTCRVSSLLIAEQSYASVIVVVSFT